MGKISKQLSGGFLMKQSIATVIDELIVGSKMKSSIPGYVVHALLEYGPKVFLHPISFHMITIKLVSLRPFL
jgi:hypothetical protein